ncbi:MAG: hypothetical protein P1R58_06185, partial [bacterium]|nr:hypothetical protein [bacterium]
MKRLSWQLLISSLVLFSMVAGNLLAEQTSEIPSLLNKGKYVPDIGTFLQIGANSPAGYSWDGKDVYFRSSISGASQIYRITEDAWPYQLTTFEDGVDFFTLAHDGLMAIVGASIGGSEQSQLYLTDPMTGRVIPLTDANDVQFGSVSWSADDSHVFFRSNEENGQDFFIYSLDVASGSYEKIFGDSSTVAGYNSIADISSDGQYMIIYNFTSNVNNDLYLLNLKTGEFSKLTEDDRDVTYYSPTIMPDGKTIWLTCNANEDGITRLARMTVGSPKVEFVDDGWIDPRWEIDGLSFSRDYKYQAALVNEDGFVRIKLRDVESGKNLPTPPLEG